MIKTHNMKLNNEPFIQMKNDLKTIELRLNDEKRGLIKIGDEIIFTNASDTTLKINCRVVKLHYFDSFKTLYETLPLLKCGYTIDNVNDASYKDMEFFYSKEEQSKYGVVGIEILKI